MTISPSAFRKRRSRARKLTLQALYQWQVSDHSVEEILLQFAEASEQSNVDGDYFKQLLRGAIHNMAQIDASILQFTDRRLNEINPVELAILRAASYELQFCVETPYKVVINEALELAKKFATPLAKQYINAVLDAAAKHCRAEVDA